MSKGETVESKARRAVQALVEGRIAISGLDPEVREFLGKVGSETAEILERIADEKLRIPSEEDDSYYCYVAADMVRAIAVAVLRPK